MNFKSIIQIFKHTPLAHVKTPLGRWNIHNYSETMLKIKYATEDNCGVSYNTFEKVKNVELEDDQYIHIMGYESVHN